MPVNHENEDYPEPEEQHREYIYWLLEQRVALLESRNGPDDADLAELAQIENIFGCYRVAVECETCESRRLTNSSSSPRRSSIDGGLDFRLSGNGPAVSAVHEKT